MNSLLLALQKMITFTLFWLVVPFMMFQFIVLGKNIVRWVSEPERKLSARAGWWAGLVLFGFFLIYQASAISLSSLHEAPFTLHIPSALIGFVAAGIVLWSLQSWLTSKAVGLITMFLSFSGSMCLYNYLFIRIHNGMLLSATLGIALGCLIYLVIFPKDWDRIFLGR